MPLLVNCSCGTRFKVPEQNAGRRVRCPGCERAVTVAAESTPPPASRSIIQFRCVCGEQLRVKAEHAGRNTRCPECDTRLTVPDVDGEDEDRGARTRIRSERPAPRPQRDEEDERPRSRRHDADEDEKPRRRRAVEEDDPDRDEEEEERPRRRHEDDRRPKSKKKKARHGGSGMLWVLLGLGGLLLLLGGGGGFAAWWFLSPGAAVSDMAFVPPHGQGFVTMRLAEMWKNDGFQKGFKQARDMGGPNMPDPASEMEKATGLRPEEVERATVAFQDAQRQQVWFIVTTMKPYDRKKLQGKLSNARDVKHEGKTYHAGTMTLPNAPAPGPGGGFGGGMGAQSTQAAMYFASPRVVIFGPEDGVKTCLTQAAAKKTPGRLSAAISRAEGKHHIVAAFAPAPDQIQQMKTGMGPQMAQYANLVDVSSVTMVLDATDPSNFELSARYNTPEQAGQAKKLIDDARTQLEKIRQTLEEEAKQPNTPPEAKRAAESFKELSNGVTIQQNGTDVTFRVTVRDATWQGLMPQMPGAPFPGAPPPQFPKR